MISQKITQIQLVCAMESQDLIHCFVELQASFMNYKIIRMNYKTCLLVQPGNVSQSKCLLTGHLGTDKPSSNSNKKNPDQIRTWPSM